MGLARRVCGLVILVVFMPTRPRRPPPQLPICIISEAAPP